MSWEKVKIGDHCEITSSKRIFFSEYVDSGVPFYRSKEIIESSQGQPISEPLYISVEKFNEIKSKFGVPAPGDMLLTSVGTIGIPYIVRSDDYFYFKDGNLTWFRNFDDELLSNYLFYWIGSKEGYGILNNTTIGSSQKALTISSLKQLECPLPPVEVQKRIVDILSAYDNLIKNNQKQIKLLEEAAQRLYREWFVDLRFPGYENTPIVDGVPKGWEKKKVTDLLRIRYGKDHKNLEDGFIPVYGSGGIMRKVKPILYSGESVLIPRKGSLNNIFYVDGDFWTIDTMFYSIPLIEKIAKYAYLFLSRLDMYSFNIGAAVPSMTVNILDGIDILLPDNVTISAFDSQVGVLFNRIELLKKQSEKTKEARDRLLPKLMSGEMEV
ncbi:MAG: restriction endonuclease subunit S [Thermoguttaceae bacterium]|nr:restriction endonuclease subunit S [Thermoguttaceae bacterium]